jgi:hypothetical protein
MFDFIDLLGSYHKHPFWSLNNILSIILLRYNDILFVMASCHTYSPVASPRQGGSKLMKWLMTEG